MFISINYQQQLANKNIDKMGQKQLLSREECLSGANFTSSHSSVNISTLRQFLPLCATSTLHGLGQPLMLTNLSVKSPFRASLKYPLHEDFDDNLI